MLNIGIVGLGHLGEIHLKQWLEIVSHENIICYDADIDRLQKISQTYEVKYELSFEELLEKSQIIDIVTPTQFHYYYAEKALKANKHVFIEKPVCESLEEIEDLIQLQNQSNTLVQIGMVERYNPAYEVVAPYIINPQFFEIHRLAPFVMRGTEVSVIMDLMIHDLDIVLHLVKSDIKAISAKGVSIVSQTPDIANVRLEFENGCVANLTASRISMKKMRKMRIFSNIGYISIDFLERNAELIEIKPDNSSEIGIAFSDNNNSKKKMIAKSYKKLDKNAILAELSDFYNRVIKDQNNTQIDLLSSLKTVKYALKIQNLINEKIN